MIVNLEHFIRAERPHWERLEQLLTLRELRGGEPSPMAEVLEMERLYQRATADLSRLQALPTEIDDRPYLENLVARTYAQIHGSHRLSKPWNPWRWAVEKFPQTFRRHVRAFWFATLVMLAGSIFGALALAFDPDSKPVLMPFPHLLGDPAKRVAEEEREKTERARGSHHATFSGQLMVNNIRVALLCMALGLTWGVGTLVVLFYNGVGLGAVVFDYVRAGQTEFLLGWLLPHGVIEIPAVIMGGQAGFVLALALLRRDSGKPLSQRFRAAAPEVVTLCGGVALLLIWAAFVESYLSQLHQPVIPYSVKIGFGLTELAALVLFLALVGRRGKPARS